MKKLNNSEMIDSLSRFRAAGDKLSEDVFELSSLLLSISSELERKADKTDVEQAIYDKIASKVELILRATLNANDYNDSMWKDYTSVIKQLGGEGVKR